MEIAVECYAGYRADETPRRLYIGERLISIARIIDRWTTPDYRYFKVEGDDRWVYLLRQSPLARRWELV